MAGLVCAAVHGGAFTELLLLLLLLLVVVVVVVAGCAHLVFGDAGTGDKRLC